MWREQLSLPWACLPPKHICYPHDLFQFFRDWHWDLGHWLSRTACVSLPDLSTVGLQVPGFSLSCCEKKTNRFRNRRSPWPPSATCTFPSYTLDIHSLQQVNRSKDQLRYPPTRNSFRVKAGKKSYSIITRLKQIPKDILSNCAFIESIIYFEQIKSSCLLIFKVPKRSGLCIYFYFFLCYFKLLLHLGKIQKGTMNR